MDNLPQSTVKPYPKMFRTTLKADEGDEYEFQNSIPEAESALPAVDSVSGSLDALETAKKLTEAEKSWELWTESWLAGIDYKSEVKPRSGRRLLKQVIDGPGKVRQLPRVRGCGHKLDLAKQPRHRNCKSCWTSFFRNQDEMSENIAKLLVQTPVVVESGKTRYPLEFTFGRKFLQRFHEYCKLVERMEEIRKAYAEEQAAATHLREELDLYRSENA